jgi:hypothetical protein
MREAKLGVQFERISCEDGALHYKRVGVYCENGFNVEVLCKFKQIIDNILMFETLLHETV